MLYIRDIPHPPISIQMTETQHFAQKSSMNTYLTPKELLPVPYLPSTFSTSTPSTIPWDTLAAMIKNDLQLKANVEHIRDIRAPGTEKEYAKAKAMVGRCVSGFKMPQNTLAAPEMPEPHVNQNQQHPVKRIYLPSESIFIP